MHIGIDASRAFAFQSTGTENYSRNLILALAKIDSKNIYTLYMRGNSEQLPKLPSNFHLKTIKLTHLWTQLGLAWECLLHPPDVLFIPAHTLPLIRRPELRTVVTIHDLGAEFLPQYHQFPGKLYLNKSTEYAVANATRLVAVSKSTKKNLVRKLKADPKKITVVYEGCRKYNRNDIS